MPMGAPEEEVAVEIKVEGGAGRAGGTRCAPYGVGLVLRKRLVFPNTLYFALDALFRKSPVKGQPTPEPKSHEWIAPR
jgi:hypothetical protein